MERRLNHFDREYMKMAMLKHEETFREQVYELHRLYQVQKKLMKDAAKTRRQRVNLDLEKPAEADRVDLPESGQGKCRVFEIEDDQSDLELTLGPRSYYQKKIKASEPAGVLTPDSGRSFSSSSTGSTSHMKGTATRSLTGEELLSWGIETTPPVTNQGRLNSPPWLIQALSLNIT